MKAVADYRQEYWQKTPGHNYSGFRHILIVNSLAWPLLLYSLFQLEYNLTALFTFLSTFLFGSFTVYMVHRYLLHRRWPVFKIAHTRHTIQHHSYFTYDFPNTASTKEWRIVLFPWFLLLGILLFFSLPVAFLLDHLVNTNVAMAFFASTIIYYLTYEWLHLYFHTANHPLDSIAPFSFLKQHHAIHHDPKLMNSVNFNLVLPIFDLLTGTFISLKSYSERSGGME